MLILKLNNEAGTGHKLEGGRITIGRDPSNDITLDDDSVSGFHAQILIENDVVELIDLGSTNGTCINDKPISGRQRLAAWQKLRFGSVEAEVQDPAGRRPTTTMASISDAAAATAGHGAAPGAAGASRKSPPAGDKRGVLKRLGDNDEYPATVDLHQALTVGRDAACDLCLPSTMVSARHARIEWRDDHVHVVDLGSTNGTRVNGKRVQSTRLSPGDRLAFDEIEYVFKPVQTHSRGGTTVNPAIGARAGGTTVRPAVDPGKDDRDASPGKDPEPSARSNSIADRPAIDPFSTRPSSAAPADQTGKRPDQTRVQPAAQAPRRPPQKARPRPPAPSRNDGGGRKTPPSQAATPSTPAPVAPPAPAAPAKPEKPQPQQVIVKQKGSGCMIAMMFIITLVIALPLLIFVLKVGFLIAIFNHIKSIFGL